MDVREREIDDIFYKYGRITDIQIKRPDRPPAFAFVSFTHPRDAEDAVYYRDGYDFDGGRLRVEMMKGGRDRDGGRRGGGGGGGIAGLMRNSRSQYQLIVSGLPKSASWQDLKDHFKKSCDVARTDVDRNGMGIVEFRSERDLEDGLKLHDSIFVNPFSESKISVVLPEDARRSGSRSPSPRGRRSRSRDSRDSRDRGRSRSRSPRTRDDRRSDSRDRGRSRSRSNDKKTRGESPRAADSPRD